MLTFHVCVLHDTHAEFCRIVDSSNLWKRIQINPFKTNILLIQKSVNWLKYGFYVMGIIHLVRHSVHWGINPPQKHPTFSCQAPLKFANCSSSPLLDNSPLYIGFSWTPSLKSDFQWTPKLLSKIIIPSLNS